MAELDDRIEDIVFVIETIWRNGESAIQVRSPNLKGLGVVAPTLKEALDDATEAAGGLRRSYGQTGPFNILLEVR